jgi:hypothetical protein
MKRVRLRSVSHRHSPARLHLAQGKREQRRRGGDQHQHPESVHVGQERGLGLQLLSDPGYRSGSFSGPRRRTPIPWKKLVDPFCGMIGQAGEHVGEPSMRIDIVELGGLDQRINRGGASTAFVRAGEGPVVATNRDAAQSSLGGIVGHAQAAVVEEAGERGQAFETVIDRLGGIALG